MSKKTRKEKEVDNPKGKVTSKYADKQRKRKKLAKRLNMPLDTPMPILLSEDEPVGEWRAKPQEESDG